MIHEHKAGQAPPALAGPGIAPLGDAPPLGPEERHLLGEVGPTLAKWAEAVRDTRRFARWLQGASGADQRFRGVAGRLAGCGTLLEFRKVTSGPLAGVSRLASATFCQHKTVCRMCAIRRSAKVLQAYVPKLRQAVTELPKRGRLVFVTLTVRDGGSLPETLGELQDGLSRLVGNCRKVRQRAGEHPLKPILGGAFSIEVKRGASSKLWHPHAHGILICDKPLVFADVKRAWWSTMGYRAVSDLRNVKPGPDGLTGAALECFKYATKFDGLAFRDRLDVYLSTFGRRLIRSFGSLRGVEVPEDLTDEPLDWDSLEWVSLLLRYRDGSFVPSAPIRESVFEAWKRGALIARESGTEDRPRESVVPSSERPSLAGVPD